MNKQAQLAEFTQAYKAFVQVVLSLPPERFLSPCGGWTPRDVVAHLIGWNRNILIGCEELRQGKPPFYHRDGPNDYRKVNAASMTRYASQDKNDLLAELAAARHALVAYVEALPEDEWQRERGVEHYRGGPATIGRSIHSLTQDFRNHTQELLGCIKD